MKRARRLVPESVVWLCANNRVAEAEQIIRNAAKMNNITMPDKILKAHWEANETTDRGRGGVKATDSGRGARYTMLDILRNRRLAFNIFCLSFLWSVNQITFICFSSLYS